MTDSIHNPPPIGQVSKVAFGDLVFDSSNPRLMTGDEWSVSDDVSLINAYREIAALDELVLSIATNGYLNLEPLIIHGSDGGPYTVLEGNRRLAAMKLLASPETARECKISIPQPVRPEVLKSFEQVLVYRVEHPKDAEAFIGFKHINGPQRWDAYAKARFVADWYRKGRKDGLTIDQIARQTGDTNDTVRSYIGSIFVLDQAEKEGIFEIKNRFNKGKFAFSHLYTALDRPEYRNFLGLQLGWNNEPSDTPVSDEFKERLGETLQYVYGSKRDKTKPLVQSQNPHLAQLGRSLNNERSLLRLRAGEPLAVAFAEIEGGNMFNQALGELMAKAEKALSLATKFDGNPELLSFVGEIKLKVMTVESIMTTKAGLQPTAPETTGDKKAQ
ncbi:ParB N-terminal domain-containing protein [Burkholderia cepacia]|uniref:ParB N-terminal domain-containing protein n=1 Tax=Burkholderia cepacia TaxID=292 RepID=UPI001CF31B1A|nr:ParB/Srx family N-terminal domain-containing protein [Burkholderia cepacia]MCA8078994.1 ParB/Srx family N-terminal domain-containing protein [Burkholderia cepacia]